KTFAPLWRLKRGEERWVQFLAEPLGVFTHWLDGVGTMPCLGLNCVCHSQLLPRYQKWYAPVLVLPTGAEGDLFAYRTIELSPPTLIDLQEPVPWGWAVKLVRSDKAGSVTAIAEQREGRVPDGVKSWDVRPILLGIWKLGEFPDQEGVAQPPRLYRKEA